MKFLIVCVFALVAASSAGSLKQKRGIFGSQEADARHGFDQGNLNGGFSGYQNNAPAGPAFDATPSFNSAPAHFDDHSFQQGPALLPEQNYLPPQQHQPEQNYLPPQQTEQRDVHHETVKTIHTHSVERVPQPYPVEKVVYKTIQVDRPVPQPVEVIKHVPQPYPVERVKEIVREVKVPQPYPVYKEIVKHVPVERLVPQPYPVVKTVTVKVDRPVPVYIHQQPKVVHHQPIIEAPATTYGVPQTTYGLPQTFGATQMFGSFGHGSYAQQHGWN